MPGCIDISIQILLRRFSRAHAIARIVVTEYVAVNALAKTHEKTGHLAQVNGIAMREQQGESVC